MEHLERLQPAGCCVASLGAMDELAVFDFKGSSTLDATSREHYGPQRGKEMEKKKKKMRAFFFCVQAGNF